MTIRYFGHSCFLLQFSDGLRILTDPYNSGIGLRVPKVEADIVTVSHDHFDHNNLDMAQGSFRVLREPGQFREKGVDIRSIESFHDNESGRKRGRNLIFRYEVEGLSICHLGDLGHIPDEDQLSRIRPVDILMIPVGEVFTFHIAEAVKTMRLLSPSLTIPMHYKASRISIGINGVDKFLKAAGPAENLGSNELNVTKETLENHKGILVMDF